MNASLTGRGVKTSVAPEQIAQPRKVAYQIRNYPSIYQLFIRTITLARDLRFTMPCPRGEPLDLAHSPQWAAPEKRRGESNMCIEDPFERTPRILLSSDNHQRVSPLRNALLRAGFTVDLASDYRHLELLWHELRHDVVLFEVSHAGSVELATQSAIRIKRQDAKQFVAYLADASLQAVGLIGDAIFSRDAQRLPQALRKVLAEQL